MSKVNGGWIPVPGSETAFTYLYSFGPGIARSLAIKGPKGFVIVSPPCNAPDSAFEELSAKGPIAALVASNAFHHLGIGPWKKRFPEARILAPAQSVARIQKKTKIAEIVSLAEGSDLVDETFELVDLPHYRTGEAFVKFTTAKGRAWYATDVLMNMPKLPPFPIGLIFKWTNTAPGLKMNGVSSFFTMADKGAVQTWLREELEKSPPALFVPCHGVDIEIPSDALRTLLA